MKKNILYLLGVVCLMASCVEENFDSFIPTPTPGKDVTFSANLDASPITRTVYEQESDNKSPIYWVHGNLISVYGSTCSVNQAEYKISTAVIDDEGNDTGTPSTTQNYASALRKTGAAGVQWGTDGTSDFYSVYPSTKESFKDIKDEDGNVVGASVKTSISSEQKVKFALNGTTWSGSHYDTDLETPNWKDAVMYACTAGATSTDPDGNASSVKLRFKPFSNVLRFKLNGYEAVDASGNPNADWNSTVYVNKIVLTAPGSYIAGDFYLNIHKDLDEDGKITGSGTAVPVKDEDIVTSTAKNTITIIPNYLPLTNEQTVEFDIFAIPTASVMSSEDPWTVTLETTSGNFTYELIPRLNGTPTDATLTAGKIHKIAVPEFEIKETFEVPADNWIRYIPRNVYLSELSVPGAWYANDLTNYHGSNATLAGMYANGIRAFHIDTRMSYPIGRYTWGSVPDPAENPYVLVCAGSEDITSLNIVITSYLEVKSYTTVESKLEEIINLFKTTTNYMSEYIVVVLTIAEKQKDKSDLDAGTIDPGQMLSAVNTIVQKFASTHKNDNGVPIIYDKKISSSTTVNDVLGRVILQVNINDESFYESTREYTLPSTFIQFGSMALNEYISGNITQIPDNYYLVYQNTPVYWGSEKTDLTSYYHQAQLTIDSDDASTSTTPSLGDRKGAIDNIIDEAYKDYSKNTHNGWYQLGIGGYTQTGSLTSKTNHQDVVARSLNPYLLDEWINPKLNGESKTINGTTVTLQPSPVGIVLMNYALDDAANGTNGKGLALVKAIRDLNTKFTLNRDSEASYGEWPDGNPFIGSDVVPTSNGAYALVGDDAF